MKKVNFGSTGKQVPAIVMGCMRMKELTVKEAAKLVDAAMAEGVDFFDHADIYGGGVCEERFKEAAEEAKISREDMWIQSKCGIVPGVMYDFSKEHIIKSAEDSLQRLGTDYLDSLLLHRPDALMEPEEVAAAFEELHTSGKVRYFGVSNQNTMQMELLSRYVSEPLMADQLQFGAAHASMIASGVEVNMTTPGSVDRDGSVLDYCRLHTPYIICNDYMYEGLTEVCDKVENVSLMTNSIGNNGNPFGSADYYVNKDKILNTGLEVWEYEGGYSYHGKSILIDDNISVIGSFNVDMRSVYLDTELMLVIDSREINSQLNEAMESYEHIARKADADGSYDNPYDVEPVELTPYREKRMKLIKNFILWTRYLF